VNDRKWFKWINIALFDIRYRTIAWTYKYWIKLWILNSGIDFIKWRSRRSVFVNRFTHGRKSCIYEKLYTCISWPWSQKCIIENGLNEYILRRLKSFIKQLFRGINLELKPRMPYSGIGFNLWRSSRSVFEYRFMHGRKSYTCIYLDLNRKWIIENDLNEYTLHRLTSGIEQLLKSINIE
jgi:hypothetical protein